MKITLRKPTTISLGLVGIVTAAMIITGCSSTGPRTAGQKWSDREIAKDVKKGLSADPTFKYDTVQANVYDGNIQLSGFVESPEQRKRAADIAAHTRGAKQVVNDIMIKSMPTGPVTIRDPLGHETGRLLVDTNSAPAGLRNSPSSSAPTDNTETTPKQ